MYGVLWDSGSPLATHDKPDRLQVAQSVCGAAPRWLARRTTPGRGTDGDRRSGRGDRREDDRVDTEGPYPLEHALDGDVGLSHSTIGRIWRTFGLKPHVTRDFRLSDDPLLIEKVRDIVGLYMSPPENAVVLCVDEKSQIQALSRATPVLPMDLGEPEQRTHNYLRHGTTDLFAALNVKTEKVTSRIFGRHRAVEFLKFLATIDDDVPTDLEVHVVLDNLSTHKTPAVHRWLLRHPRFHLHFTPTYGSWLNQVERFFGLLTEHALRRGSHNSVNQLRAAIVEYIDEHNVEPKPFRWTKSANDILDSLARFGTRTLAAHAP